MIIKILAAVVLLAFTANAEKEETTLEIPSLMLLKVTFCACMCCQKGKHCIRHQDIPDDFDCDETKCKEQFCDYWEESKCNRDCFCNSCKDRLTPRDYRCMAYTEFPESCNKTCEREYDCSMDTNVEDVNDDLKKIYKKTKDKSCVIPCYCHECQEAIPRQIYAECIRTELPDQSCKCKNLPIMCRDPKGNSAYPKHIGYTDEELNEAAMCRLQCFCKKCSRKKGKMRETCKDISKRIPVDCDCGLLDGISCPTDEELAPQKQLEAMCKVSCFCQQCKDDPRMRGMIKSTCEEHGEVPEGCTCTEEEDCNVLDGLAAAAGDHKKKTEL